MRQYTIKYVQSLPLKTLKSALFHSWKKWLWLSQLNPKKLRKLWDNKDIEVCCDDCPACRYKRLNHLKCNLCVVGPVCDIAYVEANSALENWRYNSTETNFAKWQKKATIVAKKIEKIYKETN